MECTHNIYTEKPVKKTRLVTINHLRVDEPHIVPNMYNRSERGRRGRVLPERRTAKEAEMRNGLQDMNNVLFEQLERLQDDEAFKDPETFDREMKRSKAITSIASQIIQSGTLSLKAAQFAADYGNDTAKPLLGLTTSKEG